MPDASPDNRSHPTQLSNPLGSLRVRDDLDEHQVDLLWSQLATDTVASRPNVRRRLSELSTARRILLSVVAAFVIATLALVIGGMRIDLGTQTILRYVVAMLGLLILTAAAFAVSLRGHHQRPIGRLGLVVMALTVLVPVVLAVMPWLWAPDPMHADIPVSHVCLPLGISTGFIAAGVAWLFQRSDASVWVRSLSAAGGGGLVGFAMLQLHCPAHDATHLLIGHAGVGLFIVLVTAIVVVVRQRRRSS
jgi:hypothetical protein